MNLYQRYKKEAMNMLHNMTVIDVSIFKLMMIIAGLYFAKMIPVLTNAPQIVYITLYFVGAVYIMRKMDWEKIFKK